MSDPNYTTFIRRHSTFQCAMPCHDLHQALMPLPKRNIRPWEYVLPWALSLVAKREQPFKKRSF